MDEDLIATVVGALREDAEQNATMRRIEMRHAADRCTPADRFVYRALWIAATLRRSPARAPYLPPAADELLAERARLDAEVRRRQVQVAIEAAFDPAPEDELPAAAYG